MSRYTYHLQPTQTGFAAHCLELDAEGEGTTREEAVEALRIAIHERMCTTEAIAPPSRPPSIVIELTEAPPQRDISPQGPGEASSTTRRS